MIYNYMFQCPMKYEIYENNKFIEEVNYDDIKSYISYVQINNLLLQYTKNFKQYLNYDGIISTRFNTVFGKILKICISFNHPLLKKEFDSLYTDLQIQLMDGIGKYINQQCIIEYNDINTNINTNKKEINTIRKQVHCSLWQEQNWKLVYITRHYYKQKNHIW